MAARSEPASSERETSGRAAKSRAAGPGQAKGDKAGRDKAKRGAAADMAALGPAAATALRRAASLSLIAPLLWPVQAFALAWGVSALIDGQALPLWVAPVFLLVSVLRALGEARAQAAGQQTARDLVAGERARLIARAVRRAPSGAGEDAAALASLMGEKIALLGPWAERFLPASMRTRVLPFVILALVATQSWSAALALLITGPLIPLFMALIGYAAQAVATQQLVETGALNRLLIDRIAALGDIRLLGAGARAEGDLAKRSSTLREGTMKVLGLAFLSSTVLEFMAALGVALIAVQLGLSLLGLVSWGGWGGVITPFGAVFVLLIAPDFYQPLRDLAAAWHDRAAAQAVLAELAAEAKTTLPEIVGPVDGIAAEGQALPPLSPPLVWQGLAVEIAPGRRLDLPDGRLEPGAAIALVAPSGAGKSTLLAVLAGLRPHAAGQISLGGVVLDESSAPRIRAALGWLPQQPRFPATSLGRWLTGGQPVAPERLTAVLQAARAEGVVAALPQGLNTRLGETGGGVSGGEARRLMIARALLNPPAVLLADEPTADLDPASAAAVTAALLALRDEGVALLVATHDPALAAALDGTIRWGGAPGDDRVQGSEEPELRAPESRDTDRADQGADVPGSYPRDSHPAERVRKDEDHPAQIRGEIESCGPESGGEDSAGRDSHDPGPRGAAGGDETRAHRASHTPDHRGADPAPQPDPQASARAGEPRPVPAEEGQP